MKIPNTLFITILFLCVSISVFATEMRITQLFITDQNTEYRHVFLYNDLGNVQLETRYIQSDETWLRQNQTEWFYDNGNCVKQIERVFENGVWSNTDEIETNYNRVNKKTTETIYRYVAGNKIPVKETKFSYSAGVLVGHSECTFENAVRKDSVVNTFTLENEIITQQFTKIYTAEKLNSAFISLFTYDATGKIKTQLVRKLIEDSYQNVDSITWFYDADGLLISQRLKSWSMKNHNWENTQMINYEYDSDKKLIAEVYQQWAGMSWENACRYEYQYEQGAQVRRTLQSQLYREWRNLVSINYSDFVESKARTIESEYDFWGGEKGEFVVSHIPFVFNDEWVIRRAESIRVNYDKVPSVSTDVVEANFLIKVYPNPSDGIFYLNTEKHEILSWNVYDLKGQLVQSHFQREHSGVVDITELVNGVYVLRVETTLGTHQQKLIKQ